MPMATASQPIKARAILNTCLKKCSIYSPLISGSYAKPGRNPYEIITFYSLLKSC